MLHPSTKRLIDKLSEMTHKQKVAWQEGENGQITHDTEGYRVTLTPDPCAVLLTDALGREIETCSPDDFANEVDANGRPYTQFVSELYLEARRHARGAEKAINALLAGLDDVDAEAETDEAEAEVEETFEAIEADTSAEDMIEDIGDDSDPLDPEMYPEFEGQSDMQRAVASLADQVNGQPGTAAPEEAAAEELEEETELQGFSIPPEEEEAVAEDEHTVLDEPEAGYTPTHMDVIEETQPEPETQPETAATETDIEAETEEDIPAATVEAEAAPEPEAEPAPYAPAFMEDDATAPTYAQSEAVRDFTPQADAEPETVAEEETPPPFVEETVDTFEAPASEELHVSEAPEESVYTEETAEEIAAEDADMDTLESPPASNNMNQGYFGGGFGAGALNQYRLSPAPAEPEEAASEADPEPEDTFEATSPEETETAPQPESEPIRSYSLSGITSGFGLGAHSRPAEPEPHPQSADPVEEVGSPHVVIDGTSDLPDWLPEQSDADTDTEAEEADQYQPAEHVADAEETEEVPVQEETPAPQPDAEIRETPAPAPDYTPFPEAETAAPEAHDSSGETYTAYESETFEEDEDPEPTPPPRAAKRFNPWN
ncbi:hypothetical protein HY29_12955 [Hyphomonas beringensis]|uniref:Uncharacterized protein n=1 Tax=Hyphomonas beringensis TaxID=1280946 RepID=A0A062UAS7_9PROT|nr:hypothetical protein [Hyphomonas beringensis]KCZ54828.1 hypothetical protein HY29_12955 [Hyphomonas beringensis]